MKKILIVALIASFTAPAFATDHSALGGVIGTLIGGAAGSQVGNGRGRIAATAIGAGLGSYYGSRMGAESPEETIAARQAAQRREFDERYNRSGYGNQYARYPATVSDSPRDVRTVYVDSSEYRPAPMPNVQRASYQETQPTYYRRPAAPARPQNPCDGEEYYEGEYNPPAAKSYCEGRLQYIKQVQAEQAKEAYQRGLRGE